MPHTKISFDVVRQMALALPDVEESTTWGAPTFKVRGKLMSCLPTHKSAEPNSLVVSVDFGQRAELIAADPAVYYLKDHYANYPVVLVRLSQIHPDALHDLLAIAWSYADSEARRKKRRKRPGA